MSSPDNPKGQRTYLFSTHLTFENDVADITDAQLWKMAHDAIGEMAADIEQYGLREDKQGPRAMGIMAWGREIIITSSQKGKISLFYSKDGQETKVFRSLQACSATWEKVHNTKNTTHRKKGQCVEVAAAHLFYKLNQGEDENLADHNPRVGVWTFQENGWEKAEPCGDEEVKWGCNLFVREEGLVLMDLNIKPEDYDLNNIAGGLKGRQQIQMCGDLRPLP
ncbi:hypothetical protein FQN49_000228 [Arthroderma sp. PD_2]|nr:hypothetical protein FQN49_000228 [Arthroderma sp. PD_2]